MAALLALLGLAWGGHGLGKLGEAEVESLRIRAALGQWPAMMRLRAAAWLGNAIAIRAQGFTLLEVQSPATTLAAIERLQRAAELGDGRADLLLGKLYFLGAPGQERDVVQARLWLQRAAAQQPVAHFYLALIERNGLAGPADHERAHRALQRAAAGGVPHAQFLLAQTYLAGLGTVRDERAALRLIKLAADQDYPSALQFLAHAHAQGEYGLVQDEQEANLLFALAAEAAPGSPAFP